MEKYKIGDVVKSSASYGWNKEKVPYLKLLITEVKENSYICKILNYDDVSSYFGSDYGWYFSFEEIDGYWEENEMNKFENVRVGDLVEFEYNGERKVAVVQDWNRNTLGVSSLDGEDYWPLSNWIPNDNLHNRILKGIYRPKNNNGIRDLLDEYYFDLEEIYIPTREVELTMDEIAKKFDVDVSKLKIKK